MSNTPVRREWSEELDQTINDQLDAIETELAALSTATAWFAEVARAALRGGKRLRASLAYHSWVAHSGETDKARTASEALEPANNNHSTSAIAKLATVLELFQAAALVHDDLIDQSDTRRGQPAAHRKFAHLLESSESHQSNDRFGAAGAILLGDLLLIRSDELFAEIVAELEADQAQILGSIYNRMRFDVTAGQYLDALGETVPLSSTTAELEQLAWRVIELKTVSYSVRAPLQLGAALAGATLDQLQNLEALASPLGEAFQLRDDLLGVFGDAAVTGKSTASDLDSAKRTVLLATALQHSTPQDRDFLIHTLTGSNLAPQELTRVTEILVSSGARDHIEMLISQRDTAAAAALENLKLTVTGRRSLSRLTAQLVNRSN